MSDKMREAFEEWFRSEGYSFEANADMDDMWGCWRAALTQQPESEPVYQCASKATSGWHDISRSDYEMVSQYRECRVLYRSPQPPAQVPVAWAVVFPKGESKDYRALYTDQEDAEAYAEAHMAEAIAVPLYAAPSIAEKPQAAQIPDVDDLAQFIRKVDGSNEMEAGALAECIVDWMESKK